MKTSSENFIGVLTTDAQLIVRSWDHSLERLTAIPSQAAVGQALTFLIPDLDGRGLLERFTRVLDQGVVEVLAPAFHHFLIPCPPQEPSPRFEKMQQRVTIAPLREDGRTVGTMVTIVDLTSRLDRDLDLAEQLASPDEKVRVRAAKTLGDEGAVELEPRLATALGDESWRVRRAAVGGLAQKAEAETIASLLNLLREEHHNLSILNSALQILTMSDVDIVSPLITFLNGPDVDLRVQAALALGELRDDRALASLLAALDDADVNVRFHVIEALGKLRARDAVDDLLEIAKSGDFFLAFPAIDSLIRIGDSRAAVHLAPLLTDSLLAVPVSDALGELGDDEVVAPLVAVLNQSSAPTSTVAQALVRLFERYENSFHEGSFIADLARELVTPVGVQNLLEALREATGTQLREIAVVLGWLEGPNVETALAHLIGAPAARNEVIAALVRYGTRVTDLLIDQLRGGEPDARQAAVIALGRIGDRRAVPALIEVLDTQENLTIEAAGALAMIGDARAFEPLLAIIGHSDAAIRQAAISAINSLGHPEMPGRAPGLLENPDPRVRESAVKIAGYFGFPECVELMLKSCRDDDENVRRAAIEHLPYLDDDRNLDFLAAALRNDTPKVRAAAAHAFEHMNNAAVLPILIEAAGDPDSWVRYFAARSLGQTGSTSATEILGRLANTDPTGHVRIAALESLGVIGGARAVEILAPVAESLDDDLACAALGSLGRIEHSDSVQVLNSALRSDVPARRMAGIKALASRNDPGIAEALQWVAAADEDAGVAQAAIETLGNSSSPGAVEALIELTADRARRETCIATLARVAKASIDRLAAGLKHPSVEVRRAVVEALARMKDPEATTWVINALDDSEPDVRLATVVLLGRLGGREVEQRLVSMMRQDPDVSVRLAAEKALRIKLF